MYIIKKYWIELSHLIVISCQFPSKPSLANSLSEGFTISPSILPRPGSLYKISSKTKKMKVRLLFYNNSYFSLSSLFLFSLSSFSQQTHSHF